MIPLYVDVTKLPKGFVFLNPAWDPKYNIDKFLPEIKKALSHFYLENEARLELKQIVDVELWDAARKYGEMNEALAYRIAWNTAATFVKNLIRHPDGITNASASAPPVQKELVSVNSHGEEYIPSEVEAAYAHAYTYTPGRRPKRQPKRQSRRKHLAALKTLVKAWDGTKKTVAKGLLAGKSMAKIRDVSRATAFRYKKDILAEVQRYLRDGGRGQEVLATE